MTVVESIAGVFFGIWALLPSATYSTNLVLAVLVLYTSYEETLNATHFETVSGYFTPILLLLLSLGLFSPLDLPYTRFLRPWSTEKQPKRLIVKTRNIIGTIFCGLMLVLNTASFVSLSCIISSCHRYSFTMKYQDGHG